MDDEKFIIVKTKKMIRKVKAKEVDYITQDARKVIVVCEDREYEFYGKVGEVADGLDDNFVEVLKYSFVNFDRVMAMENQCIEFFDGNKFFLGIGSFASARQKFSAYLYL